MHIKSNNKSVPNIFFYFLNLKEKHYQPDTGSKDPNEITTVSAGDTTKISLEKYSTCI